METDLATWPLASIEPRPYQTEALGRMVERGNQLLALTMGAGKTITAFATIEALARAGKVTSGFVLAPNSIKFQWLSEARRIGAPCQVIDGTVEQRRFQYKHAHRFRYTISNYDSLRNDIQMVQHFVGIPDFIVADEATQIKSLRSKRSKVLKAWAKEVPYRFALTGQPIENRPEELFSIMEFVDRTVLGRFDKFDRAFISRDHFGRPVKYRNMGTLVQLMEPAMFRRSREQIAEYLPKIITMELPVELPVAVRGVYDYMADDCLTQINDAIESGAGGGWNLMSAYGKSDDPGPGNRAMGEVMSRLTCMRLLCDHPSLLLHSAAEFDDPDSARGSKYASTLKAKGLLDGLNVGGDDKMEAAIELIMGILEEDPANRVVLFAYFKPMLRMLARHLAQRFKVQSSMLTGDLNARQRQDMLDRFKGENRVLLSSDAGQYGVDLPHVNYLVSYDLPWSAGAFAQRVARVDRTSSLFPHVTIITMMSKRTIEERQFDMLRQKRTVAEAWIDGKHLDSKGALTLTLGTLREFLEAA